MAIPDAATVAAKWASRAGSATEDYRRGIQNTDVDPTERAIAALPYAQQRYVAAIQSGKTANALRRAGKAGWQQGALGKGVTNYATGVSQSQDKFQSRIAGVLAYESNLQQQIRNMPNATLADRVARAAAWINGMANYQAT
jgi:fructose-bisphosphate aldolase class 1